jgi:hypothetical protein
MKQQRRIFSAEVKTGGKNACCHQQAGKESYNPFALKDSAFARS